MNHKLKEKDKILVINQTPIKRGKLSRFFRQLKYFLRHPIWYLRGQAYIGRPNGFILWKYPPDDTLNGIYSTNKDEK